MSSFKASADTSRSHTSSLRDTPVGRTGFSPGSIESNRLTAALVTVANLRHTLQTHCSRGDDFGHLALAMVEKQLEQIVLTLQMIQSSSDILNQEGAGAGDGIRRNASNVETSRPIAPRSVDGPPPTSSTQDNPSSVSPLLPIFRPVTPTLSTAATPFALVETEQCGNVTERRSHGHNVASRRRESARFTNEDELHHNEKGGDNKPLREKDRQNGGHSSKEGDSRQSLPFSRARVEALSSPTPSNDQTYSSAPHRKASGRSDIEFTRIEEVHENPLSPNKSESATSASSIRESPNSSPQETSDGPPSGRSRYEDVELPFVSPPASTKTSSRKSSLASAPFEFLSSPVSASSKHRKGVPSAPIHVAGEGDAFTSLRSRHDKEPDVRDAEQSKLERRRLRQEEANDAVTSSDSKSRRNSRHRGSHRSHHSSDVPASNRTSSPPVVLDNPAVLRRIAQLLLQSGDMKTTASLGLVSRAAASTVTAILYGKITIRSLAAAKMLGDTVSACKDKASMVQQLIVTPLDVEIPRDVLDEVLPPIKAILGACPNVKYMDEDFTTAEWDVRVPADYPLTVSTPGRLRELVSRRCWWEIGAVNELLQAHTSLERVTFYGAVMDREWEGQRLLKRPIRIAFPCLQAIEIAQVAHEDTLAVLLRSCGPALQSLQIGFQSIGQTDNDTPRKSIAPALAQVSHLRHLAIRAPLQASEPLSGLVDDCVAVLPKLEILEFSEQGESLAIGVVTPDLLSKLPSSLRVLRGRGLVSVSTSDVLTMLGNPDNIPVLEELDLKWAIDGLAGKNFGWDVSLRTQIFDTCADLGIRCQVDQNDEPLEFKKYTMG